MASLFTVSAGLFTALVAVFVIAAVAYGLWVWKRPTSRARREQP